MRKLEGERTESVEDDLVVQDDEMEKPDPIRDNPYLAADDTPEDEIPGNETADSRRKKGDHFESAYVLKSNTTYEAGNATYHTNERGNIDHFSGDLTLEGEVRHPADQRNLRGKEEGDHAGHLIARENGGSGYVDNMAAMNNKVNTRDYRDFERENTAVLKNGYDVHVDGDLAYSQGQDRPDAFMLERKILDKDGNVVDHEYFSWSNEDMSQYDDVDYDFDDDDYPNPIPEDERLTPEELEALDQEMENYDHWTPYARKKIEDE